MSALLVVRWIHLVAAATWLGGLLTLAALIPALRKAGAERALLQAAARQFARVSWVAMGIAVLTGLTQVAWMGLPWSYTRLQVKVGLVLTAIAIALGHQLTARNSSPALRGALQGVILLVSLGIFAAAVAI
ncbi:MAG: hypothetical protein EP330_10210 [Deltaproteobacteria bacterium]|nr:MAG: hypothetical protein EP330_10210 [Deltaproteobacteria bacterium]